MTLTLRITSNSAPLERRVRFIAVDNQAEVLVWLASRARAWDEITGGRRRLAVVARRVGGRP